MVQFRITAPPATDTAKLSIDKPTARSMISKNDIFKRLLLDLYFHFDFIIVSIGRVSGDKFADKTGQKHLCSQNHGC